MLIRYTAYTLDGAFSHEFIKAHDAPDRPTEREFRASVRDMYEMDQAQADRLVIEVQSVTDYTRARQQYPDRFIEIMINNKTLRVEQTFGIAWPYAQKSEDGQRYYVGGRSDKDIEVLIGKLIGSGYFGDWRAL